MTKLKIIVLGSFLAFLGVFYLGSIYYAYNKGYDKKAMEVAKEATEIIVGSHTDILVAAQNVKEKEKDINVEILHRAFYNTAKKRATMQLMENTEAVLKEIGYSSDMRKLWLNYLQNSVYAKDLEWDKVLETIKVVFSKIIEQKEN